MAIELDDVSSGYSTGTINTNFQRTEDELNNNVLRRDGLSPGEANQMEVELDMNTHKILNLAEPTSSADAARLQDVQNALAGGAANLITFAPYESITANNVQEAIQQIVDNGENLTVTTSTGTQSLTDALDDRITPAKLPWFSVVDYGAAADGDGNGTGTDQATSFQAAIDAAEAAGGGFVRVPKDGTNIYTLQSVINMKSDVTVVVDDGVQIDSKGGASISWLIGFIGSAEAEVAITGNRGRGDTTIGAASHGYSVGDIVHIVSQRNALSSDAGDWRCGFGTPGSPAAYFAEWKTISEVISTSEFGFQTGLIFPSYRVDDSQETDANARASATVQRITPVENSHWVGGEFLSQANQNQIFQSDYAVNCSVKNVIAQRGSRAGQTVRWRASYNCYGHNIKTFNDSSLVWDYGTYHGTLNRYMTVGTQDCGFIGCEDSYGTQSFDPTYGTGADFVNVRTVIDACKTFNAFEMGVTTHPGCFQTIVQNSKFLDCARTGITFRGLQDSAINNEITGANEENADGSLYAAYLSRGIEVYAGHSKGGVFAGNRVSGFRAAFGARDAGNLSEASFDTVDLLIEGNNVSDCHIGFVTDWHSSTTSNASRGVHLRNNTFRRMGFRCVYLGEYSAGCTAIGNTFRGPALNAGGNAVSFFNGAANCPGQNIQDNSVFDLGTGGASTTFIVNIGSVTDTAAFPSGTWANKTKIRNHFHLGGVDTEFFVGSTNYVQTDGTPS